MLINRRKYMINNNKKILHKIGKSWVVISTILLLALAGGTTVHANIVSQNTNQPQQENSMANIPVQNQSQSTHANLQPTNNESQIMVNSSSWHSLSPVIHNHPFSNSTDSRAQSTNFSTKSNNTQPNNNQIASTSTSASVSASMSEFASAHSAFISSSVAQYNSYVASTRSSESRASSASISASESDKARQANSQSNYAYSVINNPSFINSSLASSASHSSFISNSVAKYRSYEASVNASKYSASQSYSASTSASKASYNSYVASIRASQSNHSKSASVSISASLFSSESVSQSESQSIMNSIEYIDTHAEISSYVAPPQRYVIHSNSSNSAANHMASESNSEAKLSGKTNMSNIQPNSQANKANNKTNNTSAVNSNHEKERNSNSETSQQSASFRPIAYNHQLSNSNSFTQPVKNKASLSISATNQASSNVVVSNSHQSINPIIRMPGSTIQTNVSDEPIEYSTSSQINANIQPKLKTSLAVYRRLNEQSTRSLVGTLNGLHSSQKLLYLKTKSSVQLSTKSLAELNNNVSAKKLNTKSKVKKNKEVNRHRLEKLPQTNEVKSYQLLALIMLISAMVINATGYVFIKHHE